MTITENIAEYKYNKLPKNAKGLGYIAYYACHYSIVRIIRNGVTIELNVADNDKDAEKLAEIICEYQITNNISSIYFDEVRFMGKIFRYPTVHHGLLPLPQDIAILNRYKNKIVDWFVTAAYECQYRLHYKLTYYDLIADYWYEVTLPEVVKKANTAKWVELNTLHNGSDIEILLHYGFQDDDYANHRFIVWNGNRPFS